MRLPAMLGTGLALLLLSAAAPGDDAQARGAIKVCHIPGLPGSDYGAVYIPADGTYTGACDRNGENCRDLLVGVTASKKLAAGAGSCVVLEAVLLKGDGQPLRAGEKLLAHWDTGTFEPAISVVKTFK